MASPDKNSVVSASAPFPYGTENSGFLSETVMELAIRDSVRRSVPVEQVIAEKRGTSPVRADGAAWRTPAVPRSRTARFFRWISRRKA